MFSTDYTELRDRVKGFYTDADSKCKKIYTRVYLKCKVLYKVRLLLVKI